MMEYVLPKTPSVTLYTTGCPKCNVLEAKLDQAGITYLKEEDVSQLIKKGFASAPVLEVDEELMEYKAAIDWVNKRL